MHWITANIVTVLLGLWHRFVKIFGFGKLEWSFQLPFESENNHDKDQAGIFQYPRTNGVGTSLPGLGKHCLSAQRSK